jgi:hypothetical protein
MIRTAQGPSHVVLAAITSVGVTIGIVVAVLTSDVVLGVIAGSALIAISIGLIRLWTGGGSPRPHHP